MYLACMLIVILFAALRPRATAAAATVDLVTEDTPTPTPLRGLMLTSFAMPDGDVWHYSCDLDPHDDIGVTIVCVAYDLGQLLDVSGLPARHPVVPGLLTMARACRTAILNTPAEHHIEHLRNLYEEYVYPHTGSVMDRGHTLLVSIGQTLDLLDEFGHWERSED